MADEKISLMPAAAALTGAELVPLVQSATNKQENLTDIAAFVESTLDSVAAGTRWAPDIVTNPGTMIGNTTLSTGLSGGDTLMGGTGGAENLLLQSTSNAAQGTVALLSSDPTYTSNPATTPLFGVLSTRTVTSNYASQTLPPFIRDQSTRVLTTAGNAGPLANIGFEWRVTYKNANGVAAHLASGTLGYSTVAFMDRSTVQADGAAVNLGQHVSFRSTPTFSIANAGSFVTANSSLTCFQAAPTIGAGASLAAVNQFLVIDVVNSGTIDTQTGVNIPVLAGATVNIGILNASTTVNTPTIKAITVVGDTIPITAGVIRLNNTSGSSKTLTSAPTMANGQDGQIITLINTSANDVVIQDQGTLASSNLRLTAASITLSQRDNVTLMYNTIVGDWVQITNVVNIL